MIIIRVAKEEAAAKREKAHRNNFNPAGTAICLPVEKEINIKKRMANSCVVANSPNLFTKVEKVLCAVG